MTEITKIEFRAVIHYEFLLGTGPIDIHARFVNAYGEQAPSLSFVKKWLKKFTE